MINKERTLIGEKDKIFYNFLAYLRDLFLDFFLPSNFNVLNDVAKEYAFFLLELDFLTWIFLLELDLDFDLDFDFDFDFDDFMNEQLNVEEKEEAVEVVSDKLKTEEIIVENNPWFYTEVNGEDSDLITFDIQDAINAGVERLIELEKEDANA